MSLTPEFYRPRLIDNTLQKYLCATGAVSIEGPRWCGKTFVGLNQAESACFVSDYNEYGARTKDVIKANIKVALDGDAPRLIDEWQEFPAIWDAVRIEVDRKHYLGHYILTGSSTPKKDRPLHNGAGRISVLQMRTMSLFESGDSTGEVSLRSLFERCNIRGSCDTDYRKLVGLVLRGGWPELISRDTESCRISVASYLERQISDAAECDGMHRNRENIELALRSLARNESTLATLERIRKDTGIPLSADVPLISDKDREEYEPAMSRDSLADYLGVFRRMYLVADQPAFSPGLRSSVRVGKAVKRHLADPSLAASLLGADSRRLENDPVSFGFLFEALCERDLDIYARSIGGRLCHYRDSNKREIDAVVELPDGRWGAFEIKVGWGQVDRAAEGLLTMRKVFLEADGTEPEFMCVLYGTGGTAYRRDDGVYVVPICTLRD